MLDFLAARCANLLAGARNTQNGTASDSRSKVGFVVSTAFCREYQGIQDPAFRGIPGGRSVSVFLAPGLFFVPGKHEEAVDIHTALEKRRNGKKNNVFLHPLFLRTLPPFSTLKGGGCCSGPTEEEPPCECESSSSSSWFPSEAFQSLSAEQIGVLARLSVMPGVDSLVGHLLEIVQFSNDCGQDIGLACGEACEMSQSVHQFGVLRALVGKDFSCANVDLLIHQLESFKQLFHLIGGHDSSSPVGGLPPVDPTGEESFQNGCSQAREGSGK